MKSRLKQRIFALSLLAWTAVCPADAQQTRSLRDQFLSPSDEAKPWTFWYWMYGAVSKEEITADLEAMKRAGLGGTYLMPIKGIHEGAQYDGKAQQLTPEWWEMVRFSMEEADRLYPCTVKLAAGSLLVATPIFQLSFHFVSLGCGK